MKLYIITAFDPHQVIGHNNQLPWHIPEDLAYFKKTTLHHPIVMGRKTFESIGKPLPHRHNIVISSTLTHPDVTILSHPDELLSQTLDQAFIIGGATLYRHYLPHAHKLYITHIDKAYPGDTYFPDIDWSDWSLASETLFTSPESSGRFCIYNRNT